jgi:hypothetical protein
MTTPTRIEESPTCEARRAAAERESLARQVWIETLGFEGLAGFIFFEDHRLPLAALKAMVVDWSSYLALKEAILLWPQAPAPIKANNVRAELSALYDGSDPQSLRDRAIRRLLEMIGASGVEEKNAEAIKFQRIVGRFGSEIIFDRGKAKVGYKIFGSGEGGSVDLPFYRLEWVNSVAAPWGWKTRISQTARVVTVTIPAADAGGLGSGMVAEVWLSGKGS